MLKLARLKIYIMILSPFYLSNVLNIKVQYKHIYVRLNVQNDTHLSCLLLSLWSVGKSLMKKSQNFFFQETLFLWFHVSIHRSFSMLSLYYENERKPNYLPFSLCLWELWWVHFNEKDSSSGMPYYAILLIPFTCYNGWFKKVGKVRIIQDD